MCMSISPVFQFLLDCRGGGGGVEVVTCRRWGETPFQSRCRPQPTAHSRQLAAHSSWPTACSPQVAAHNPQITAHSSQLVDHNTPPSKKNRTP